MKTCDVLNNIHQSFLNGDSCAYIKISHHTECVLKERGIPYHEDEGYLVVDVRDSKMVWDIVFGGRGDY